MRVPASTYRLQFHAGFTFDHAQGMLDHLSRLGVTDIYASPILKAVKGSLHGYDVVDPLIINPELGGAQGLERLMAEVGKRGMGWVQDIVPNHMAVDSDNGFLMDVLESGPDSRYFDFFDIDWNHPYAGIRGVVLLPVLGRLYGECLEAGELTLAYGEAGLSVGYFGFRLPLSLDSYPLVFEEVLSGLKRALGPDHPDVIKLLGVLFVLKSLPGYAEPEERADQVRFVKRLLWELNSRSHEARRLIGDTIRAMNGKVGEPASFDRLDQLLLRQHYRLAFWKIATQEINYRRFFSINSLISLKAEREEVFEATHGLILELVGKGWITGLRVDHVDGLLDPTAYLRRLRSRAGDVYVVVEKILARDEELPSFWPVQGTSGYDFASALTSLACDPSRAQAMAGAYVRLTGQDEDPAWVAHRSKRLIIEREMAGDLEDLAHHIKEVTASDRMGRDITLHGLKLGLAELLAWLPVYRTYLSADVMRPADRDYLRQALERALASNPDLHYELGFLARFLLMETAGAPSPHSPHSPHSEDERRERIRWAMRFQQLAGPIMAKGVEDTFLYVHLQLLALNEVGGDWAGAGWTRGEWHDYCMRRAERWPHSMSASSTHDTKRGEDARMRLAVLTELPERWEAKVWAWRELNRGLKRMVAGRPAPDDNDEYGLYQTLLGAWPPDMLEQPTPEGLVAFGERVRAQAVKAVREAKVHTGWIKPNQAYEEASLGFLDGLLDPGNTKFLDDFLPFAREVAWYGGLSSLAMLAIKMCAPGVADFYQGSEGWNLSLVDPDNRRPVDYAALATGLEELPDRGGELLESWADGRAKLWLTWRGLTARRAHGALFLDGDYLELSTAGRRDWRLAAFARRLQEDWLVCAVPLHLTGLSRLSEPPLGQAVWGDTRVLLPPGAPKHFVSVLTGQALTSAGGPGETWLDAAALFSDFPAAILLAKGQDRP